MFESHLSDIIYVLYNNTQFTVINTHQSNDENDQ